jgi:hypothetical protein
MFPDGELIGCKAMPAPLDYEPRRKPKPWPGLADYAGWIFAAIALLMLLAFIGYVVLRCQNRVSKVQCSTWNISGSL